MNPNQPAQGNSPQFQAPSTQQFSGQSPLQPTNPYGFILDTQHKPKNNPFKGGSLKSRLLLVLSVAIVLILAIVVISSLINGAGKANIAALTSITAQQQEIVRVANLGLKTGKNSDALAFTELTKLSVASQQKKLTNYLKSKSVVITPLILASGKNKGTDSALEAAIVSGKYDDTLVSTLKASLTTYAKDLQKSYENATNPTSKTILADSYKSTVILLK